MGYFGGGVRGVFAGAALLCFLDGGKGIPGPGDAGDQFCVYGGFGAGLRRGADNRLGLRVSSIGIGLAAGGVAAGIASGVESRKERRRDPNK